MASLKVDLNNQSLLLNFFTSEDDVREKARLASLGLPHAGDWLGVVPLSALGLHMRGPEFIACLKYRLGIPPYSQQMALALLASFLVTRWEIMLLVAQGMETESLATIYSEMSFSKLLLGLPWDQLGRGASSCQVLQQDLQTCLSPDGAMARMGRSM